VAGPAVVAQGDDVVCAWRRERDVFLAVGANRERVLGEGGEPQLFAGTRGVHALWITRTNALVHSHRTHLLRDPRAGAAFPCTAAPRCRDRPDS